MIDYSWKEENNESTHDNQRESLYKDYCSLEYQTKESNISDYLEGAQTNRDFLYDQLFAELFNSIKDSRISINRITSANISATKNILRQNDRVIEACERELKRKDIQDEYRREILEYMDRAAKSSVDVNTSSQAFQHELQGQARRIIYSLLGGIATLLLVEIGYKAYKESNFYIKSLR